MAGQTLTMIGFGAMAIAVVAGLVLFPVFHRKKVRLSKELEREYGKKR